MLLTMFTAVPYAIHICLYMYMYVYRLAIFTSMQRRLRYTAARLSTVRTSDNYQVDFSSDSRDTTYTV